MSIFIGLLASYALLFAIGWVRTGFGLLFQTSRSISGFVGALLLIGAGLVAIFTLLAVGVSKSATTIDSPVLYYLSMIAGVCLYLYFNSSKDTEND